MSLTLTRTLFFGALAQMSLMGLATAQAQPAQTDPVIKALRHSDAQAGLRVLNQSCQLLQNAHEGRRSSAEERKVLIAEIAGKLRERNPELLYARGDAALLGLYGLPKNPKEALRFYTLAAAEQSPEGGYNAALMLYRNSKQQPDPKTAQHMLDVLQKSTAINYNVKGFVAAQAHFLAAQIHDRGLAGRKDLGKAFLHYRVSARNGYVPGIYHYLRMLAGSVAKLAEAERAPHVQEMRSLASRWKWASSDIMRLTGDLHAAGWIPDSGGFHAQYHWRIAARMGGGGNARALQGRLQSMPDSIQERRLENAVSAALKQHDARSTTHELEFANVCSP